MHSVTDNILIIEARFYEEIAESLLIGTNSILESENKSVTRVSVPGVFEIPSALQFAWDEKNFDGCITLGCVIRGETDHYNHICREVSRALMDLSIKLDIPHGFGILTCENLSQARERADIKQKNIGARAAIACLRMVEIKLGEFKSS